MNKNKTGLVLGLIMGLWHLLWSLLVAVGVAQLLLNFVLQIHFLNNPFVVAPFGIKRAVTLIVVTSLIGYIVGWVFAWFWNRFHKTSI